MLGGVLQGGQPVDKPLHLAGGLVPCVEGLHRSYVPLGRFRLGMFTGRVEGNAEAHPRYSLSSTWTAYSYPKGAV